MLGKFEYGEVVSLFVENLYKFYTFEELINEIEIYNGYSIEVISPNLLKVTDNGGLIHYLLILNAIYYYGASIECSVCKLVSNKYIIGNIDTFKTKDTRTYEIVGFDLQGKRLTDGQISKLKILGLI